MYSLISYNIQMRTEWLDSTNVSLQDHLGLLNPDKDYRGLKIIQFQALNVFSHFAADGRLGQIIGRYVGEECYSRNRGLLERHYQRLDLVYGSWNSTNKGDLFYALIGVDKAEIAADPKDTFLTGKELGLQLFSGRQLDKTVGFSTANYPDFQRDVTTYLLQQLCRVYFANPEVRLGIAVRRRLSSKEAREIALQQLAQGRITRGLLPYSDEDVQTLIRLWLAGEPRKAIAASLDRTEPSVQFHVEKFDLPHRLDTRKWTDEEVSDVIRLRREKGLTFAQIGEILVRSGRSVQHKLIEKGVISFHRKLWEVEETQRLAELLATEYSWATVLQKLSVDFPRGRTVQELIAKATHSNLRINTEFQIRRSQLEQLLAKGLSDTVIADKLGVAKVSVYRWKKRLQAEKENKQ